MNTRTYSLRLLVTICLIAAAPVLAATPEPDFDFSVGATVGYDSNVGIDELDDTTGEADSLRQLVVAFGGRFDVTQQLAVRLGYDYAGTSYRKFSEYDLGLHHVLADATYRHTLADLGLSLQRYTGLLDGQAYLDVTHVSPSLSKLFGSRLFVRAAYLSVTKDYTTLAGRDATSTGYRLDSYFLRDGMSRFVSLTLQSTNESTIGRTYDHRSLQGGLTVGHRFETVSMTADVRIRARYEQRDYPTFGDLLDARRKDQRIGLAVDATVPLSDYVSLEGALQGSTVSSTYEPARSREIIVTVGLKATF